ncbi:hypothetical protein E8E14_006405 [Neopestalotiopsis sp. 37M]|nr:hypothetical protein E8E14_006405 [Neopestalotiopsis sp. 37M]
MDGGPEIQRWQDAVLSNHDILSQKSLLASLFTSCSELFVLLIHSLSEETPPSFRFELQRSHDRLVLWADAYGIEEGKFESKLEMSQRIGDFTLRTLKSVWLLPIIQQHGATESEHSLKAANLWILAESLSVLIQGDDSSDDSSGDESEANCIERGGVADLEKLRDIIEDLDVDTECLLDLGTRLEEQVVNPIINEKSVDPQTIDGWDPSKHFVERIRRLYPSCENDLAKRLGQANWERVLKFQGSKERNISESIGLTTTVSTFSDPAHLLHEPKGTTSLFHDSGVGTSTGTKSLQPRSKYAASLVTQVNRNDIILEIPELSLEAKQGMEFNCTACGERLNIQDDADWKHHIISDLQPYTCLERGCESLMFLSKSSWIRRAKSTLDLPTPSRRSQYGLSLPSPPGVAPPVPFAASSKGAPLVAEVLYDFSGQHTNELNISSGQIIEIVEKQSRGWWLAKSAQGRGWVPAAYVEEIKAPTSAHMPRPVPSPSLVPTAIAVVAKEMSLQDYKKRMTQRAGTSPNQSYLQQNSEKEQADQDKTESDHSTRDVELQHKNSSRRFQSIHKASFDSGVDKDPDPPIKVDSPQDTTAMKRARNILAARKSREIKAQRLDDLESQIRKLEAERDHWKRISLSARGQNRGEANQTSIQDRTATQQFHGHDEAV